MCVSVENALRLAILGQPESFGLLPEDVNPLLRFMLMVAEGGDEDSAKLVAGCFDECSTVVYQKVVELLKHDATRKPKSAPTGNEPKPAKAKSNGKAAPSGAKLSTKQLRYLGYLYRQLGEEPDYKAISILTQKQATMRIREMEEQLGVANEA
jgi:hypothetical protein